jgi:tetratricopeptide (TPR) repeat protein
MNHPDQAISSYRDALEAMPESPETDAVLKVMTVLLAREQVARVLTNGDAVNGSAFLQISELDRRLRNSASHIDKLVGKETLADWRQAIHPENSPWWWNLDQQAAAEERSQNPLWTIPAAVLFLLSLTVIADTITTLKNGGLNRLSVFGTLMQTVLALIAGSTFLVSGREWLEKLFVKFKVDRKFQGGSRVVLAAGVFVLTLAISLLLPNLVARYRNYEGDKFFNSKQYADAVTAYQQAVALEPSFVKAHFNLALAYDKSRDYSEAIDEYEHTLTVDGGNYIAGNNLARLYIIQTKDYGGALRLLNGWIKKLQTVPVDLHYYLYKNRGWAHLERQEYAQAQADLEWALNKKDGPAAHYLLGRALAAQGNVVPARQQWDTFMRLADQENIAEEEVEANWIADAHEQLFKRQEK